MTEERIIQGCINEEKAAQKYLYDAYSPKMYYACLRYARHASEAQDVLQDGFIKVFDNTGSFKSNGSFVSCVQ